MFCSMWRVVNVSAYIKIGFESMFSCCQYASIISRWWYNLCTSNRICLYFCYAVYNKYTTVWNYRIQSVVVVQMIRVCNSLHENQSIESRTNKNWRVFAFKSVYFKFNFVMRFCIDVPKTYFKEWLNGYYCLLNTKPPTCIPNCY